MSVKQFSGLIGADAGTRKDKDFYPTPAWVVDALIDNIDLPKQDTIWEPACGNGAISERLINYGKYHNVYSSDLYDYGYGDTGIDFIKTVPEKRYDHIITNPPFNLSTKFTVHGLNLAKKSVIVFNKLSFLEGKERKKTVFYQSHLKKLIIFSERVNFEPGGKRTGGMMAFAWFIFEKGYGGKTEMAWI